MTTLNNAKVLIVDDEPDACTSLRRILRLDGYDVDIAHSVAEMLEPGEWSDYFAVIEFLEEMVEDNPDCSRQRSWAQRRATRKRVPAVFYDKSQRALVSAWLS